MDWAQAGKALREPSPPWPISVCWRRPTQDATYSDIVIIILTWYKNALQILIHFVFIRTLESRCLDHQFDQMRSSTMPTVTQQLALPPYS